MLESMLALPLGAVLEALLFLLLYRFTPMNGKQTAVVVVLLALAGLLVVSLFDWPGADVLAMYVAVLSVTAYLLGIVASVREQRRQDVRHRWFHWGPAVIIVFFISLFALDSVFVVISKQGLPESLERALLPDAGPQKKVRSVFPGTVANDFQKKEALYNEYLQQVERQQQRGWLVRKGWLEPPLAGAPAAFQVQVTEADGEPVRFAEVSGIFQRPSDSRQDQSFVMQETQPGRYRVQLALPEPGNWDLVLQIRRGGQLHELHARTSVAAEAAR